MISGLCVPVHRQNQAGILSAKTPNALRQRLSYFIQYRHKHSGVPNSQKANAVEAKTILGVTGTCKSEIRQFQFARTIFYLHFILVW